MTEVKKWPRDLWLEAIWEDESLKPAERCVAYVFARYAGKGCETWCSWDEMRRRTGIGSRDTIWRSVNKLRDKGWLKLVDEPRQHRSAVYRLRAPVDGPPDVRKSDPCTPPPNQVHPAPRSGVANPDVRNLGARGPIFSDQTSDFYDPRGQIENSDERSDIASASRGAAPPFGRRSATAQKNIAEAISKRAVGIATKIITDETDMEHEDARPFIAWLLANRPQTQDLVAYVRHLADEDALRHLVAQFQTEWDLARDNGGW